MWKKFDKLMKAGRIQKLTKHFGIVANKRKKKKRDGNISTY